MILEEFSGHDINEFLQDLLLLLKMSLEVDEMYSEGSNLFYQNRAIFEQCCALFTRKYRTFILKPFVKGSGKPLKIFFLEKDLVKMYKEVGSRVDGLVGISNMREPEVPAQDAKQVAKVLATLRDKLYINYNPDSVILEYKTAEDKAELIYDASAILKNKDVSPEFKFCCYYALKGGYDRAVNMQDAAKGFVFHTRPDMHQGRFSGF